MSLVKFQILLTAVEKGSLSAAAEQLGYTQSGVSHMLNSLENELGITILTRSKSGVQLTPMGAQLLPYIRNIVHENENFLQFVSDVTGVLKGKLVIGSFATVSAHYLPDIIYDFRKIYPEIEFELRSGIYCEIEKWIENKEVDCGFISLPTKANLNTVPVVYDRMVVVSGKSYPHHFPKDTPLTAELLLGETLILMDGSSDYDIIRLFGDTLKQMRFQIVTNSAYGCLEMVKKNVGIGILPIFLANEYSESLDIFEIKGNTDRTLAFAYGNKKEVSPIAKKFIQFIESRDPISF